MKVEVGLIRVLTVKDDELLNSHGRLIESYFPDLKVISRCIDAQPRGIYSEETEKTAIPKIVKLGREMENVSAIIVSCAADPGVKELRKIKDMPVIGAGSSSASLSLSFGSKIGTLGITESTPPIMKEILGEHLVAEVKPEGVETTLDLMTDEGKKDAISAVKYLRKREVDVIALACTGYSTIAQDLEKAAGIPVIDAVVAAGLFTWYFTKGYDHENKR
ncbi:MAG TPA: hydantoin racemase [Thermoplasmata archaeon]|nr:hydantoin racemase [Thermoplasmata archaeon]